MKDCLFCQIASHDLTAEIVYEDSHTVAFRDINPQAPVHVLVIPKRHVSGVSALTEADADLMAAVLLAASHVAGMENVSSSGYRCVINTGSDAQQSVDHLHLHVLGGRPMSWPPG